ncbi:MAG: heavy metal translocating P-type ATPase [Deltaproteobacteria bacterium]|nr:heavy metal translocating P-type ATPase [Deltaproteobacteria bacterium]
MMIQYNGTQTSASIIIEYIKDLPLSKIRSIKVPARPIPTINIIHLDDYPKANLALSLFTLIMTLYGSLSVVTINLLLCITSLPVYRRAVEALVKEKKFSVDFLDAAAHISAQIIKNYPAVAFMSAIINVGDLLRQKTTDQAKQVLSNLLAFEKDEVWVIRHEKRVKLPVLEINMNDLVIIYPGQVIPIDGAITKGTSSIDQKSLTGESLPVTKTVDDKVYAGTIAIDGVLEIKAERVGQQTSVARVVRVVTEGAKKTSEIEDYARKFGDRLVLPVMGISAAVAAMAGDLSRFTSMVIVDYGTGMRVSAPTAFLSEMIAAARSGILIKGGSSLEKMNKADTIIFDKTGTLTQGAPSIEDVISLDPHFSTQNLVGLAAAAASKFTHPVGLAVFQKAKSMGVFVPDAIEEKYIIGHGVESLVQDHDILFGSEKFMALKEISTQAATKEITSFYEAGKSVLFLAINGKLAGLFSYSDTLRPEAVDVIKALRSNGIKKIIMLTGDSNRVARAIADQLKVDDFISGALPEQKLEFVRDLQNKGHTVVMVGDGINDSPALTLADVGITVRSGVELAKESASVVLMEENLWKIVETFEFAHNAIHLIEQNRKILYVINAGVFAAAGFGLVSPVISSVMSDGASLLATLNSLRPLTLRGPKPPKTPQPAF